MGIFGFSTLGDGVLCTVEILLCTVWKAKWRLLVDGGVTTRGDVGLTLEDGVAGVVNGIGALAASCGAGDAGWIGGVDARRCGGVGADVVFCAGDCSNDTIFLKGIIGIISFLQSGDVSLSWR